MNSIIQTQKYQKRWGFIQVDCNIFQGRSTDMITNRPK